MRSSLLVPICPKTKKKIKNLHLLATLTEQPTVACLRDSEIKEDEPFLDCFVSYLDANVVSIAPQGQHRNPLLGTPMP